MMKLIPIYKFPNLRPIFYSALSPFLSVSLFTLTVVSAPLTYAMPTRSTLASPAADDRLSIIDLSKPAFFTLRDTAWEPAPKTFPPGAMVAVLEGDPNQGGPFTMRIKLPENYEVPAHWCAMDEHISVITGNLFIGMGDKLDKNKGAAFPAGSFARIPLKMHHYLWTTEETVIQLHGIGPWIMGYVTPKQAQDQDPTKTAIVTTPPGEVIPMIPGVTEIGAGPKELKSQNSANDASLSGIKLDNEDDQDLVEELRKKGRLR